MTDYIKQMLNCFLAILLATNLGLSQSQEYFNTLKDQADFVYEGSITKSISKWNADHSYIYTEHEIKITKVFKGDIRENTAYLITPGGITEGEFMFVSHTLELGENSQGVFFAKEKEFEGIRKEELKENTHFAKKQSNFFPKRYNENVRSFGYGALKAKDNYEKVTQLLGEPVIIFPTIGGENPFEIDCNDLNVEVQAEISFKNFEFSANLETVEFDIMMKSNPEGLNFGKSEYKISFPEDIFGTFPIQNNAVEFTQGDLTNGNDDYELTVFDEASNKINVQIELTDNNGEPVTLSDEETQILHCIFTIEDPTLLSDLELSDFEFEGQVWFDCDGRLIPFDRVMFKTDLGGSQLGDAGINFKLQKFRFRTQGPLELLSFDIYASSNEPQILNTAELYIDYGAEAFGSLLNVNTQVSLAKGAVTAEYFDGKFNEGDNTLKFTLTKGANSKPAIIDANPQRILSVTLVAENCGEDANISWNDLTDNENQTYLEGDEVMIYSPVIFEGSLTTPMCGCNLPSPNDPVITSFSINFEEEKIQAGTGEVLKIFGDNFGEVIVDGSCYIEVENADHQFPASNPDPGWNDTDRTRIPLDDIIDWTNNEITFVVPSTTLGSISAPTQSGDLIVFTECGESDAENIDVEYAVLNVRQSNVAYRVALEKQTESGIQFSIASNVGSFERGLTEYAVTTWCNQTNIGWSVLNGTSTANSVQPDDEINLVIEVDSEDSPFISGSTEAGVIVSGTVDNESYIFSCNTSNNSSVKN